MTEAHIVAAALTLYKMESRESEPVGIHSPASPFGLEDFMEQVVGKLLDTYIPKFFEPIDAKSTKAAPIDPGKPKPIAANPEEVKSL